MKDRNQANRRIKFVVKRPTAIFNLTILSKSYRLKKFSPNV